MSSYVSGSVASAGGFGAPKSISVTGITGLDDVAVWCAYHSLVGGTPAAPTCNGNPMTLHETVTIDASNILRVYSYALGTPGGNATVAVNNDGNDLLIAWASDDTDQTTPFGGVAEVTYSSFDSVSPMTVNATAASASDYVFGAMWGAAVQAVAGSASSIADDIAYNNGGTASAAGYQASGAGSQAIGFTMAAGNNGGLIGWVARNAALATLTIDSQPSTGTSGEPLATIVVDSSDESFSGDVTATVLSGDISLGGTVTVAAVGGVATFANLIPTGVDDLVLRFSAAGHDPVDSTTIAVGAAPPPPPRTIVEFVAPV